MRITQIMLGKGFGGAERSFVDTTLALAARGHTVQAICHVNFVKINLLENIPNVQLDAVVCGGQWDFVVPWRIAYLLKKFGSQIVHTQLKRAAWHGGRGGHLAGVPVVSKLHNYVKLTRYKYVHTLIGTTEDQYKYALADGWDIERVVVIPNFSCIRPAERVSDVGGTPLRFLTYGRYVQKKGFDVLLHAFRQLLDSGVDARLIIGGQGPERDSLEKLVHQLALRDHVKLGVWIEDVTAELDASDVFVLPSRDEPFGIVMLEAMSRGLPIISTRTQGPLQVLGDETARLVEIDNDDALFQAMAEIAHNPKQAQVRAAAALELYAGTYYEGVVLPKIESLYERILAR